MNNNSPVYRAQWLWMLPILLIAVTMSAHFLTLDALWGDEVENLRNMGIEQYGPHTVNKLIEKIGLTRWPPAYNIVSYPWIQLTGTSEFSLRSLSIFIGVIAISLMYQLGALFTDHRWGLIAALILATSAFFIFYMHEMRGYILYILMTISSLYLYQSAIHAPKLSQRRFILLVCNIAILIYTHYIALLMAITLGLYHLIFERQSPHWGRILRALIFAGVCYIPWIIIAFLNALGEASDSRGLPIPIIFQQILYAFSNGLPLLLALILLYTLLGVRNAKTKFLWFCIGTILALALGLNFLTDYLLHIRHISSLFPLLILVVVSGLYHLYQYNRWIVRLILVIWVGAGIFSSKNTIFFDELRGSLYNLPLSMVKEAVDTVSSCATEQDAVIAQLNRETNTWNQLTIEYYFYGYPYRIAMLDYMRDLTDGLANSEDFGNYRTNTEFFIDNIQRVWVIRSKEANLSEQLEPLGNILSQTYDYCEVIINTSTIIGYIYQNESEFSCQSEHLSAQTLSNCTPNLLNDAIVPND